MVDPSDNKAKVRVQFACDASDAQTVLLVGDFNEWNLSATPMKQGDAGRWSAEVDLLPGHYEYKFVIDGCWCCAPGEGDSCDSQGGRVPNIHGTMNRVIEVS